MSDDDRIEADRPAEAPVHRDAVLHERLTAQLMEAAAQVAAAAAATQEALEAEQRFLAEADRPLTPEQEAALVAMRSRAEALGHVAAEARERVAAISGQVERDQIEVQAAAREFLKEAIAASGLTAAKLARRAGIAPSTISRPLNDPDYAFVPRPATLEKIAHAAGVAPPERLYGASSGKLPPRRLGRRVPLVGEAIAGSWQEPRDAEPSAWIPVDLREYEGVELEAYAVLGSGLDHWTVIAAPYGAAGLRDGDWVVLRRFRQDLVETSVRRAVRDSESGVAFLPPLSTDPSPGLRPGVELPVEGKSWRVWRVLGVVVQAIAPRFGSKGPLLKGAWTF